MANSLIAKFIRIDSSNCYKPRIGEVIEVGIGNAECGSERELIAHSKKFKSLKLKDRGSEGEKL